MREFVAISSGRQRRSGCTFLPRHRHRAAYLALVLQGGYEEAGDRGRYRVRAGDIVLHEQFEAHLNRYETRGAEVLNLVLPDWVEPPTPVLRASDPDFVVRMALRDASEAASYLLSTATPVSLNPSDWPDALARDIASDPGLRLGTWAREHKLSDATVSRGFRQVYGVSPCSFRLQVRGIAAWKKAVTSRESLSDLSLDTGFSDQAHMTRTVAAITGRTPGVWRQHIK